MANALVKVFVTVREHDRRVHVASLTEEEIEAEGEKGLEQIALAYCEQHKLTLNDVLI